MVQKSKVYWASLVVRFAGKSRPGSPNFFSFITATRALASWVTVAPSHRGNLPLGGRSFWSQNPEVVARGRAGIQGLGLSRGPELVSRTNTRSDIVSEGVSTRVVGLPFWEVETSPPQTQLHRHSVFSSHVLVQLLLRQTKQQNPQSGEGKFTHRIQWLLFSFAGAKPEASPQQNAQGLWLFGSGGGGCSDRWLLFLSLEHTVGPGPASEEYPG
eukprot:gene26324-biopygen3081